MMEHPELKVKVLYFSLEMSAKEKYNEFLCHLLLRLDNIRISTRELRNVDKPCDPHIYDLLESERYQKYITAYDNMVIFNDTDKNPTGIDIRCREYAKEHGKFNYITEEQVDETTGAVTENRKVDPLKPYTQDDPDEYRIIILDNAANLTMEKTHNKPSDAILDMSKRCIALRKTFNYVVVLIQHQAQSQEGIENIKLDRLRPTTDGLGDCKVTSRDINCIMGLYSPFKFKKKEYCGYDITMLGDYCRFLEIVEDRDYGANGSICGLFFDGATSMFKELPKPDDIESLHRYYDYIKRLRVMDENFSISDEESESLFS